MSLSKIDVVYKDAHLLVLLKPSGLPTTSPDNGPCLAAIAAEMDPNAERMHPSSRLDAEVTGMVTFARTTRAIESLKLARERGEYRRLYIGMAEKPPVPSAGTWTASIAIDSKDPRRRVAVSGKARKDTKEARTRYEIRATTTHAVQLNLWPETGRTHQLRVHASHAGVPLLGDVHYGGKKHVTSPDGRVHLARRTMLHCYELELPRVGGGAPLQLRAEIPDDMAALWKALGG